MMFLLVDTFFVPQFFGVARPAAYSRSEYWSEAFIKESAMVADLSITRQTSVGDVRLTADFAGRHINVVGGLRRTEPVPAD